MQPDFDPYYKWLGIRPQEQPPTLYRLLGIADFETDLDVISHAADQRMAHVRSLQTGKHAAASQKLLTEISAARVSLLNPDRKSAYDAELRARRESAEKAAAAPAVPVAAPTPVVDIKPVDAGSSRRSIHMAVVGGVALLIGLGVVGAVVGVMLSNRAEPPVAAGTPSAPTTDAAEDDAGGDHAVNPPAPPSAAINPPLDETPANETPASPAAVDVANPPAPVEPPHIEPMPLTSPPEAPVEPATAPPTPVGNPPPDVATPVESAPVKTVTLQKLTVPAEPELRVAKQRVKEIFESDYLAAKDDAEKMQALAATILRQAEAEDLETPARYALLQIGAEMAALGGDAAASWKAYDALEARFDVDAAPLKRAMIEAVAKMPRPANQNKAVAQQMLALVDAAAANDELDSAALLSESSVALARKASDTDLLKRAVARDKEVKQLATRYNEQVKPALAALETNADDPAANLAVGKYLALVKADWERALPMLAKATHDAELHPIARQELSESKKVGAADKWYDLAQTESDSTAKNSLLAHAKALYQADLPALAGLEKTHVERRLAELNAIASAEPAPAATETQPSGPSVIQPPKSGQRTPVKVVASGCNNVHVRVNGIELFPKKANRETSSAALAALREGDIIAVEIDGRIDTMSVWLVFLDAEGQFLFETSTDWWAYRPPDVVAWWNIVGQKLEHVIPAEYCDLKTQYVDRVQRAISTTLPEIPLTPPIRSTLAGPDQYDPVYLYYVVQKADLIPKQDHKRPAEGAP